MIIDVRVNNFKAYPKDTSLSLKADMRIKKFNTNVLSIDNYNIVKCACVYGGNNVGKTCLVQSIESIRNVLMGAPADVSANIFSDNKKCSMGITFLYEGNVYSYDFVFDATDAGGMPRGFIYERMASVATDKHGNETEHLIFLRDIDDGKYFFEDDEIPGQLLEAVSPRNILIYTISGEKFSRVSKYKDILFGFAQKIDVVDMNNVPVDRTLKVLKENENIKNKTIELIKLADIEIENYEYDEKINPIVEINADGNIVPREVALQKVMIEDVLRLKSVHKGVSVPSLMFDSTGTKKIVALASYVVDAIENGKTLIVDELDSSLHFKLTRAIVALFNNDINVTGQLICTIHDITLLDCKRLLRKDQIWFANKDMDGAYLKSLASYTSAKDNIRSNADIMEKYSAGLLGKLPEPDLISILLEDE